MFASEDLVRPCFICFAKSKSQDICKSLTLFHVWNSEGIDHVMICMGDVPGQLSGPFRQTEKPRSRRKDFNIHGSRLSWITLRDKQRQRSDLLFIVKKRIDWVFDQGTVLKYMIPLTVNICEGLQKLSYFLKPCGNSGSCTAIQPSWASHWNK